MKKQNELRIGNLILVNGEVQSVCELPLPKNCTPKNTEPMPLTKEWLIKGGFEVYKETDNFTIYTFPDYTGLTEETFVIYKNSNSNEWQNKHITPKLEFVHQIQNFVFVLTGEELIFNL